MAGETLPVPRTKPAVGRARPTARARGTSTRRHAVATPYLFLAPYAVLFFAFVLLPAVLGVWISLHNWDQMLPDKPWVGLRNYTDLFRPGSPTSAPFWQSMKATGIFMAFSVPLLLILPLGVAVMLNNRFPGRNFFRAMYFAPYVLGVAVVGILWRFLLDPNIGLVNVIAGQLGLPSDTAWTTGMPWAWVSLIGITVWWTLGFNAVIYLAGLQDISNELYDAAKVDGASPWQRFRNVTLPGLRPIFLFVVVTTTLSSANMFGQAFLVTAGAPSNETRTAIYYIAQEGFRNFRLGSAAAMSYVLSLFLMGLSLLIFLAFRRKED
jgi:multiple sugar transport system permease protein